MGHSIWGNGQLVVKRQGHEVSPQILNQPSGLELEEGLIWTDFNDCFFNIPPGSSVKVGNGVKVGMGVHITTAYHPLHPDQRGTTKIKNIVIGRNVFIGTGAIIIGGVTIGDNSVIGAGAVVTRDIPPDTFAAGVPAKPICSVYEWKDD